jgi:hypothetical protein
VVAGILNSLEVARGDIASDAGDCKIFHIQSLILGKDGYPDKITDGR